MNKEKAIQSIDAIISSLNDLKAALSEEIREEKSPEIEIPAPSAPKKEEVELKIETVVPAEEKPAPAEIPSIHLEEPVVSAKAVQEDISLVMPTPTAAPQPKISEPVIEESSIQLVLPDPILERESAEVQAAPLGNPSLVMPESYSRKKDEIPEQYRKREQPVNLVLPDQAGNARPMKPSAPVNPADITGMLCPKCQSLIPEGSNFCDICGTPIKPASSSAPKRKFCSRCGTEALANDRFCMKCGNRLD